MTNWRHACALLALALGGCVVMPTAPTWMALPGSRSHPEQFRADESACRAQAQAIVSGPSQAAASNAAANAAAATAVGAAAGALLGAATGDAGAGAAIGGGMGLLVGSTTGANYAGYSSYELQYQYDASYSQCMYARGHRVPARFVDAGTSRDAPPRYPPPDYPPPVLQGEGGAPPARPPNIPPPNAPPPRG